MKDLIACFLLIASTRSRQLERRLQGRNSRKEQRVVSSEGRRYSNRVILIQSSPPIFSNPLKWEAFGICLGMFENGSHRAERIVMSLGRIGASVNSAWCEINNRSSYSLLRSALRHSGSCHKAVFFQTALICV